MEVLIHPNLELLLYLWKAFDESGHGVKLFIRHMECLWELSVTHNQFLELELCPSNKINENVLRNCNGGDPFKTIKYPDKRISTEQMFEILRDPYSKDLKPFDWVQKSSSTFLENMHVNLCWRDFKGDSVFHAAARHQVSGFLQKVIDKIPDINMKNSGREQTMLHLSVESGNTENVKMLCRMRADINAKDIISETPLMYAARIKPEWKALEIVDILLQEDPDVNLANYKARLIINTSLT